jgi:hypothetical protein
MDKLNPLTTHIKYTIEDDGKLSTLKLSLADIEQGKLYSHLHDTELHTVLVKVIKRELIVSDT